MGKLGPAWLVLALALGGCGRVVVADAGQDAAPPGAVDVVGTWHDCASTLTFAADGTTTLVDHRRGGCVAGGTYEVEGEVVTTTWTESGCGAVPEAQVRRVIRVERGITSVDRESGEVHQRASADVSEHRLYRLEGREDGRPPLRTILGVVGDATEPFDSGCYWSEDDACGGLFSCSGEVVQWRIRDGALAASVACMGECPCGAVITADVAGDGSVSGTYRGVNCDRTYEGTLTATRL